MTTFGQYGLRLPHSSEIHIQEKPPEGVVDWGKPFPPAETAPSDPDLQMEETAGFLEKVLTSPGYTLFPIAIRALSLVIESAKAVLEKFYRDDEEKAEIVRDVTLWEQIIGRPSYEFLRAAGDDVDRGLAAALFELKMYGYAARYGQYHRPICEELEHEPAKEYDAQYWQGKPGWHYRWLDINNELSKETSVHGSSGKKVEGADKPSMKAHAAIERACIASGQNYALMLKSIQNYAVMSSLAHMSVLDMVENGMWHNLRQYIAHDLKNVVIVTPPHLKETMPVLLQTINTVFDEYFLRNHKVDPNNMNYWFPNPRSYQTARKLREDLEGRPANKRAERNKVVDAVVAAIKSMRVDYVAEVVSAPGIKQLPPTGTPTSQATGRLPTATEKLKECGLRARDESSKAGRGRWKTAHSRRRTAMNGLVYMGRRTKVDAGAYLSAYVDVEAPLLGAKLWTEMEKDLARSAKLWTEMKKKHLGELAEIHPAMMVA